MANKIQAKRTSVSGRTPNTTNSSNGSYIDAGEFAVNLADKKVFTSNGTVYFEVGSNVESQVVTGSTYFGLSTANITINSTSITVSANSTQNAVVNSTGFFINDVAVGTGGGGGGGNPTLAVVEVSLASHPMRSGRFTISGAGLSTGKPVMIQQAVGPYTGKGTLADEAEMDQVHVTASVTNSSTITAYWTSPYLVRDNFKFQYFVGA